KFVGTLDSTELSIIRSMIQDGGNVKWKSDHSNITTLTYSFAGSLTSGQSFAVDYESLFNATDDTVGSDVRTAAHLIFDYLSTVTNLRFKELDESNGEVGTIRFVGLSNNLGLRTGTDGKQYSVLGQTGLLTDEKREIAGDVVLLKGLSFAQT